MKQLNVTFMKQESECDFGCQVFQLTIISNSRDLLKQALVDGFQLQQVDSSLFLVNHYLYEHISWFGERLKKNEYIFNLCRYIAMTDLLEVGLE